MAWRGGRRPARRGRPAAWSLDHLVRAREERLRNRQPQRLRGLEIDNQLELRRLLHGQVARLGTAQDFVDVGSGAPELVRQARPIGHEKAGLRERSPDRNARQAVLYEQLGDLLAIADERWAARSDQSADPRPDCSRDRTVEIRGPASL